MYWWISLWSQNRLNQHKYFSVQWRHSKIVHHWIRHPWIIIRSGSLEYHKIEYAVISFGECTLYTDNAQEQPSATENVCGCVFLFFGGLNFVFIILSMCRAGVALIRRHIAVCVTTSFIDIGEIVLWIFIHAFPTIGCIWNGNAVPYPWPIAVAYVCSTILKSIGKPFNDKIRKYGGGWGTAKNNNILYSNHSNLRIGYIRHSFIQFLANLKMREREKEREKEKESERERERKM